MKRTLALLLAVLMVVSVFAGCSNKSNTETTAAATTATEATAAADNATYTYKDSVPLLAANWNPHTYQTNDDAYL